MRRLGPGGQKLNESLSEDPLLEARRLELLQRLEAPRAHAASTLPCAEWVAARGLARVTRSVGKDLGLLGEFSSGEQWLRPEEALCLVEESLLALYLPTPPATADTKHSAQHMSVQEAYKSIVGGSQPALQDNVYTTYAHLFRTGFLARPHPAWGQATKANPSSGTPDAVFNVYHRRSFSRNRARDGLLAPLFVVAVFASRRALPSVPELCALSAQCAPTPLRCAILSGMAAPFFLEVKPPIGQALVPMPPGGLCTSSAAVPAAPSDVAESNGYSTGVYDCTDAGKVNLAVSASAAAAAARARTLSQVPYPTCLPPTTALPSTCTPAPRSLPPPSPPLSPPPPSASPFARGVIVSGEEEEEEEEEEGGQAGEEAVQSSVQSSQALPHVFTGGGASASDALLRVPSHASEALPHVFTGGGPSAPPPVPPPVGAPVRTSVHSAAHGGGSAASGSAASDNASDDQARRGGRSAESHAASLLHRLEGKAAHGLREAALTRSRPARTDLETTALSAARCTKLVEQAAAYSVAASTHLASLAETTRAFRERDEEALGCNAHLWHSVPPQPYM